MGRRRDERPAAEEERRAEQRARWDRAIAEAQVRLDAEEAAAQARTPLIGRTIKAFWRYRKMLVPPLVMAALLATAVGIRAIGFPAGGIAMFAAVLLAVWWWLRARTAASPAAVMLRPVLAAVYLVLAAML